MSATIKKNVIALGLIITSISLLILLQCLWIMQEYNHAEQTFRNETNLVFRNTIYEIMDSRFRSSYEILDPGFQPIMAPDSSGLTLKGMGVLKDTSDFSPFNKITSGRTLPDGNGQKARLISPDNNDGKKLFVYDSEIPQPKQLHEADPPGKRFIVRFDPDSLDIDTLSQKFSAQLQEISRDLKFQIIKRGPDGAENEDSAGFMTEFVKIGPQSPSFYAVSFIGVNSMLLKEIFPQISFSAFLTFLTIGAFLIIYKNLLAQQNLVKQKDEFISNLSHELKTPVATVSVALEALKSFRALENPKRTEEYLNMAQSELNRLSNMTDMILNTMIYDSKKFEFETEQVDLSELILQMTDSMKLVWEKHKAIVSTEFEGKEFLVLGSRTHLTNVINNLLDNAVKYSKPPAKVHIILKEERHQLVLIFKDNGIGIPPEYQNKVFEKFFRVPQENIHNVKGYGLGLSYVAQVVKAHQGRIEVVSKQEKGSIISIKIPKYGSD